jgi:hypothetical protein
MSAPAAETPAKLKPGAMIDPKKQALAIKAINDGMPSPDAPDQSLSASVIELCTEFWRTGYSTSSLALVAPLAANRDPSRFATLSKGATIAALVDMKIIPWPWATFIQVHTAMIAKRAADATKHARVKEAARAVAASKESARIAAAAQEHADRQEAILKKQKAAQVAKAAQLEKAEAARNAAEAAKAASTAAERSHKSKVQPLPLSPPPPPLSNPWSIPLSFLVPRGWIDGFLGSTTFGFFVELSGPVSLWTAFLAEFGIPRNSD